MRGEQVRGMILDGQKVRAQRRERGWTQAHLADAAEVSIDTIGRAEASLSISLENALAVAAALNVELTGLNAQDRTLDAPSPRAMDSWPVLVARARTDLATIYLRDPDTDFRPRIALPADVQSEDENLPCVRAGGSVILRFASPQHRPNRFLWTGWHIAIFARDSEGWICWLPRFLGSAALPSRMIFREPDGILTLPPPLSNVPIRIGYSTTGREDIVLVVSRESTPQRLTSVLASALRGEEIMPALNDYAIWLRPRIDQRAAEIIRASYRVTPRLPSENGDSNRRMHSGEKGDPEACCPCTGT
jgi:transcriptional regulator with XRE-family HTH domain